MNILRRLENAYVSGGLKEIARKAFFHYIYRLNNYRTKRIVMRSNVEYGLNNQSERERKIIVSMTSFPKRFEKIHLCLKSLLLQSEKPDRLIVYLGSDSTRDLFTKEMLDLEKYGVEYRIDDSKNLRSHKKYFYAMQEFPEDVVVTVDDDVFYPSNWLSSLLKSYEKYPNAISARRVHKMRKNADGLMRYNLWEDQCRRELKPRMDLIATGCGGILYPPHSISQMAFDDNLAKQLCFAADDIWLKCMATLNNTPVVWAKNWEVDLMDVESDQKDALSASNVDFQQNDVSLKNVMDYFKITAGDFFR